VEYKSIAVGVETALPYTLARTRPIVRLGGMYQRIYTSDDINYDERDYIAAQLGAGLLTDWNDRLKSRLVFATDTNVDRPEVTVSLSYKFGHTIPQLLTSAKQQVFPTGKAKKKTLASVDIATTSICDIQTQYGNNTELRWRNGELTEYAKSYLATLAEELLQEDNLSLRVEVQVYDRNVSQNSIQILEITEKKAKEIKDFLAYQGMDASRVIYQGYGSELAQGLAIGQELKIKLLGAEKCRD
jgi:hypothetical protein